VRVLLDTNAFIWLTDDRKRTTLGKAAKRAIADSAFVYVSSISLVELRMKMMIGKMKMVPNLTEIISESGLVLLDFKADHAETVPDFPSLVRHDPFDRMLLAQASAERMTFLTADTILLGLNLPFVVDARE